MGEVAGGEAVELGLQIVGFFTIGGLRKRRCPGAVIRTVVAVMGWLAASSTTVPVAPSGRQGQCFQRHRGGQGGWWVARPVAGSCRRRWRARAGVDVWTVCIVCMSWN